MKLTPVIIERAVYKLSHDDTEGLDEIIESLFDYENSIYILHPQIPTFFQAQNKSLNIYDRQLLYVLNEMEIEKPEDLTEDYVLYYYDKLIEELTNTEECTVELYHKVYEKLERRNLLLWIITNNIQLIQLDIVGLIYSVNNELLEFHSKYKLRHLLKMVCYKWIDVSMIYQWNHISQKCDSIINEYEDTSLISKEEMEAYYQLQWLLMFAMFLSGDYEDVVKQFDNLRTHIIESFDPIVESIIDVIGLFRVITLCIILTQKNSQRSKYWSSKMFYEVFFDDPELRKLQEDYENNDHTNLDILLKDFKWCLLLNETFDRISELLLQKKIIQYLSVIQEIEVGELCEFLQLPYEFLFQKIMNMITVLNLPLAIEQDTIVYVPKVTIDDDVANIHHNIQREILRLKAIQVNKLINN